MLKYIVLGLASFWMTACAAHDEFYYQLHPKVLQNAIQNCPEKHPASINCDQLKNIALRVNQSAYQLRVDPQGYGKQILMLQQAIAKQESTLQTTPNEIELRTSLNENKRHLQERLAIVRWLESPEG